MLKFEFMPEENKMILKQGEVEFELEKEENHTKQKINAIPVFVNAKVG